MSGPLKNNNHGDPADQTGKVRACIEASLRDPYARLPTGYRKGFEAYQNIHYRRFLLLVNLLGIAAYWTYGIADLVVIPDVGLLSVQLRTALAAICLPIVLVAFRVSRNIRFLDLLLPLQVIPATGLWFYLLNHSQSAQIVSYQYASIIFIVLANLCVQLYFLPSLVISSAIAVVTFSAVHQLADGHTNQVTVFVLVYLPIFLFSLFISWSTTLDRRRAFLRALLEDLAHDELAVANRKLEDLAHTDSLTGLNNRRCFESLAHKEFARSERHSYPMALLFFDVDHFKRINDSHGHEAGDRVLQALSSIALQDFRGNDILARFGGEEFVILLPSTTPEMARVVAERLRERVEKTSIAVTSGIASTSRSRSGWRTSVLS